MGILQLALVLQTYHGLNFTRRREETQQHSSTFKGLGFWLTYHTTLELRPLLRVVWEDQWGQNKENILVPI